MKLFIKILCLNYLFVTGIFVSCVDISNYNEKENFNFKCAGKFDGECTCSLSKRFDTKNYSGNDYYKLKGKVRTVTETTYYDQGNPKEIDTAIYEFNEKGNLIRELRILYNGLIKGLTKYSYINDTELDKVYSFKCDTINWESKKSYIRNGLTVTTKLSFKDKQQFEGTKHQTFTSIYDSNGYYIMEVVDLYGIKDTSKLSYDSIGRLYCIIKNRYFQNEKSKTIYLYENNCEPIGEIVYPKHDTIFYKKDEYQKSIKYEYDHQGNWIKNWISKKDGKVIEQTRQILYYPN
jgi:hypothetical protein